MARRKTHKSEAHHKLDATKKILEWLHDKPQYYQVAALQFLAAMIRYRDDPTREGRHE